MLSLKFKFNSNGSHLGWATTWNSFYQGHKIDELKGKIHQNHQIVFSLIVNDCLAITLLNQIVLKYGFHLPPCCLLHCIAWTVSSSDKWRLMLDLYTLGAQCQCREKLKIDILFFRPWIEASLAPSVANGYPILQLFVSFDLQKTGSGTCFRFWS